MTYHILYEACPWHARAALFNDKGELLTLRFDDAARPFTEGTVVWGRVRKVESSLGAAFVDIGDTQDAFLPLSTLTPGPAQPKTKLKEGQPLLVRVTRSGFYEKGARLDARVAMEPPPPGTPTPTIMAKAPSLLTRMLHDAGAHPTLIHIPDARLRDAARQHVPESAIAQLNHGHGGEEWFERLDTLLDTLNSPRPAFPFPGGKLIVELTSAVATIDVDAGPLVGAAGHLPQSHAQLALNMLAAEHAARLMRLLDLGGVVIVDFITPKSRTDREAITQHLVATAQASDDRFVEARPMSRHGIVEVSRERSRPSLPLLMAHPTFIAGRMALELWRHAPGTNPKLKSQTVTCHPQVAGILKTHLTQQTCLTQLGRPITIIPANPLLPLTATTISG